MLSIIIPALNESVALPRTLAALQALRERGAELILVDGGSDDNTLEVGRPHVTHAIVSGRGRSRQMNLGASLARYPILLFLHADTTLPPDADRLILEGMEQTARKWGRFDVAIEGRHPVLRLIASAMNVRSRWTGIATGDQAIFCKRAVFEAVGGFPPLPLMEDVALSRELKRQCRPLCLRAKVTTSGRRWEAAGVWGTILLMWRLRFLYFLGVPALRLARFYKRP